MFKVFSKKGIANTLLILLTILIVTVSGITLTNVIKNHYSRKNADHVSSVIDGELV